MASRFLADHCLDMRMLSVLVRQMEEAMLTSSGTSIGPEMTTSTRSRTVIVPDLTQAALLIASGYSAAPHTVTSQGPSSSSCRTLSQQIQDETQAEIGRLEKVGSVVNRNALYSPILTTTINLSERLLTMTM